MKHNFRFKFPELVLVVLLLISGLLLGFSSGGFLVDFNKVGFTVMSTVQSGVNTVSRGVVGFFRGIQDLFVMKKEYAEMKEKLANYDYLQRNNVEIRKENELLREQLDFAMSLEHKNIAAQIVGRDPDSLYSSITINKGVRNGVKKGLPVIAIQNGNVGVVGKIVTVGLVTSQIMPIYDSKCNISARMQSSREIGIISGGGSVDKPLSMSYINKRSFSELSRGDIVVTSGENGNYMRDVPVGTISKIESLEYDSSLDIELKPILDFSKLETVLIVDPDLSNDRETVAEETEND